MLIAEVGQVAAASIRRTKELAVRAAKGRVDLNWIVDAYRGDTPVATAAIQAPDSEAVMHPVGMMTFGFCADVIAFTSESWFTDRIGAMPKDPRTGKVWERGAMANYVEENGFDGVVREMLTTTVVNRAGDITVIEQPYLVNGREVEWLPRPPMLTELLGLVPDGLTEIMNRPTTMIDVNMAFAVKHGVDSDRARDMMDLACAEALQELWSQEIELLLYAKRGSQREQLLRTKLARRQVADLSRLK